MFRGAASLANSIYGVVSHTKKPQNYLHIFQFGDITRLAIDPFGLGRRRNIASNHLGSSPAAAGLQVQESDPMKPLWGGNEQTWLSSI
jgi:hypothetical protein